MENEIVYNGALPELRPEELKSKDWTHEEVFGFGMYYPWSEKPMSEWHSFPISNQDGSGMCGPFSVTKALGIDEAHENGTFVNLNKAFIYNKRLNQGTGMFFSDVLNLACSVGAPTDPTASSENINDEQASKIVFNALEIQEATKYRGKSYLYVGVNIDTLASLVEQGYTPILLLRCSFSEYTAEPTVNSALTEADFNVNHFVAVVDATLHNGKKCLIIEDSWGQQYGYAGRRIFSEDFIKARVESAAYIIDLKNQDILKPTYTFHNTLTYNMSGEDVKALQKILQYEKFLPTTTANGQPLPLGKFLGMTANALKKWQIAHGIMDFANENDMTKIQFGNKSIALANTLY